MRVNDRTASSLPTVVLHPGYVCAPEVATKLCAVATSGVAVTVYDRHRKRGGMGYYLYPRRRRGQSTALFAAPAIVSLVEAFLGRGSRPEHLEAALYGGAENPAAPRYEPGRGLSNVAAARDVLRKLGLPPATLDTGGHRGRKIAFLTATGETLVAHVQAVRADDWYPVNGNEP